MFIREAWNAANIIEVTKQELAFLCGIEPTEKFDTDDNEKSKFKHYEPEVVKQLWHGDLKVLFVTNGTSKIHYYTPSDNGFVSGMEDAPITPFTGDMSISGDAIAAGTSYENAYSSTSSDHRQGVFGACDQICNQLRSCRSVASCKNYGIPSQRRDASFRQVRNEIDVNIRERVPRSLRVEKMLSLIKFVYTGTDLLRVDCISRKISR
ncbi:hypothetical protein KSP40_PGU019974 [Platanthera guangdongensis]|uniref:Uncharacterized protein n=1 Tax=Platanthera guangdongensis TaxID=2320717 RepID=A0ABR2MZ94_9ASPA